MGLAIGNALETKEAFEVLHGGGPDDLRECTMVLGAEMLRIAGIANGQAACRKLLNNTLRDGTAIRVMQRVIKAQHGDPRVVEEPDRLPSAPYQVPLLASRSGIVTAIDALEIGRSAVILGAGRQQVKDHIDPAAGMVLHVKLGDRIKARQPLLTVHSSQPEIAPALRQRLLAAVQLGSRPIKSPPLVLEAIPG